MSDNQSSAQTPIQPAQSFKLEDDNEPVAVSYKLSQEDEDAMRTAFEAIDVNKDGFISKDELKLIFKQLEMGLSEE